MERPNDYIDRNSITPVRCLICDDWCADRLPDTVYETEAPFVFCCREHIEEWLNKWATGDLRSDDWPKGKNA